MFANCNILISILTVGGSGIDPENVLGSKEWRDKWVNLARNQFSGFSGNTSLHGVTYIGELGRHWFER